ASSALALDPQLGAAAELLGRLMLEPPRELPPEVAHEIYSDDRRHFRSKTRLAIWVSLIYAGILPPLVAGGYWTVAGIVLAAIAINTGLALDSFRRNWLPRPSLLVGLDVMMISLLAWIFPPVFIAPVAAALMLVFQVSNPFMASRRAAVLTTSALVAAIAAPIVFEIAGIRAETMTFGSGTLVLRSPMFFTSSLYMYGVLLAYVIAILAIAALYGRSLQTNERVTQRQLYLQSWQRRQRVA